MSNTKTYVIGLIVIVVLILVIAIPIRIKYINSQPYPDVLFSSYGTRGAVMYNTDTIIDALKHGNFESFSIIDDAYSEVIYSVPHWKQSDYLLIAEKIREFGLNEATNEWSLHDAFFYADCSDQIKFDIVIASYYKSNGLNKYDAIMIGIYPSFGEGEWGYGTGYPKSIFEKLYSINLDEQKIKLEDAIKIAEDSGGAQTRIKTHNRCRVHFVLSSSPYPKWYISYSIAPVMLFEMRIDAYTGESKVISIKN
jgi:hypothetical protein